MAIIGKNTKKIASGGKIYSLPRAANLEGQRKINERKLEETVGKRVSREA